MADFGTVLQGVGEAFAGINAGMRGKPQEFLAFEKAREDKQTAEMTRLRLSLLPVAWTAFTSLAGSPFGNSSS